jgi:CHAT domain-containing protein
MLLPAEALAVLENTPEVVIVPYGNLFQLPFAILTTPSGAPLGSVTAIRYAPSLTALREAEARAGLSGPGRRDAFRDGLVAGNPLMPVVPTAGGASRRLEQLPGAQAEALAVSQRLGATTLTGAEASEATIRKRLPEASVIHLATHGFAYSSEARTRQSFLALAPGDGFDGLLTVGELLDDPALKLSAEIVVLSACETGLGNLRQAEGTVGFQRAFLGRGARSVLVSLWSVSDLATSALMTSFYRHWLDDRDQPSKAEALRRAQNDVRRMDGFGQPQYWAAFQLVGAN